MIQQYLHTNLLSFDYYISDTLFEVLYSDLDPSDVMHYLNLIGLSGLDKFSDIHRTILYRHLYVCSVNFCYSIRTIYVKLIDLVSHDIIVVFLRVHK